MTADELARAAMALPGWRWMPGMETHDSGVVTSCWYEDYDEFGRPVGQPCEVFAQFDEECPAVTINHRSDGDFWPNIENPATAGCLLDLLGHEWSVTYDRYSKTYTAWCSGVGRGDGPTRGAACVAAAIALGRWPGGAA